MRFQIALTALALVLVAPSSAFKHDPTLDEARLRLVDQERFPLAACLDGSAPPYYVRPAPPGSPNASKWCGVLSLRSPRAAAARLLGADPPPPWPLPSRFFYHMGGGDCGAGSTWAEWTEVRGMLVTLVW